MENYILYITFISLASIGGEFLIYLFRRSILEPRTAFRWEFSGLAERACIVALMIAGGWSLLLVPAVILARASYLVNGPAYNKLIRVLSGTSPAFEFQKVKVKSDLIFTIISSPVVGIFFGLIAKIF